MTLLTEETRDTTTPDDENGTKPTERVPPADADTVESIEEEVAKRKHPPQKHYSWALEKYVWLMPLSAYDQRELNRMQVKKVTKPDEITGKESDSWEFDPIGLPLVGVALSWTNAKGQRNRGNRAVETVGQFDPAVITELWEIVQKITNWSSAEKNSVKTRGGAASSSSR